MKDKCENCKEEITNAKITMSVLTAIGYQDKNFCSEKCFISFIGKKYKNKLNKLEKK